jgi:hypothetical protein
MDIFKTPAQSYSRVGSAPRLQERCQTIEDLQAYMSVESGKSYELPL